MSLLGLNVALPIIPKNVNTLATQHCCIKIIKRTVKFLNPGQTPIDTCDQPVDPNSYYTLYDGLQSKEVVYIKY